MNWPILGKFLRKEPAAKLCFCTLAIHKPYRERARILCADLRSSPIIVLTDEPADFADLPVRAIFHAPTGPMAKDYLERLPPTGNHQGAAAYHDKRFALQAALKDYDTALFLDADTRLTNVPRFTPFPAGISLTTVVRRTLAEHLELVGSWRRPAFEKLAIELTGSIDALHQAKWCQEACFTVTKDGNEDRFFEAWGKAADIMQSQNVFSGEGGVIGLSAHCAGWPVEFTHLAPLETVLQHEGGGPKQKP